MRIRLGILDNHARYAALLASYFGRYYADQLEIYLFDSHESYEQNSIHSRIDVLLANPDLLQGTAEIPSNIGVAYFSESRDVESIREVRAVCRYQKAELIYKEILSIYSEIENGEVYRMGNAKSRILLFRGASGGAGTTTVATACAVALAYMGRTVLYLNLEENGVISHLLQGEGTATLSDVLYAVKSRHSNLALKLDSMVRRDSSGVCYYEPFSIMLDGCSLAGEDVRALLDAVRISGTYDYIVLDVNPHADESLQTLMSVAESIFLVCDGTEVSGKKLTRLVQSLAIEDDREDGTVLRRTSVVYNRFGHRSKTVTCVPEVETFAVISKYEGASPRVIRDSIAGTGVFSSIR